MTPTALAFALSLLWPQPRQAEAVPPTALHLPLRVEAPAELEAPAALLRRELTRLFGDEAVGDGATPIRLGLDSEALPHPEEYTVEPDAGAILLRAHDPQGAFWAVHTLVTLLGQARRTRDGWSADLPRLRDWPASTDRAFMIQGAWSSSPDDFKRAFEVQARMHLKSVAIEFGPQVVLDFDPSIAVRGRFSKAEAKELVQYARSLGLQPIGYLNLLGHLDRGYQKAPYTDHGGIDIRNDETYDQFVYPILSEMLDVYGDIEYFHAGMDEAWELFTWLSQQGEDVTSLIARHIQRVDEFLKARGVKLVIWHDMLIAKDLADQLGAPVGPANGGPPQNTAAALGQIPKDVILDYWFYTPHPNYPVVEYFRDLGFTVWASPWQTPFSFVRYAQARDVPTMGTLWTGPPGCFSSPTYSPVTALYAQAAWSPAAAPDDVSPEPALRADAQRATNDVLWHRPTMTFPGHAALLLTPEGPTRIDWPPADNVEQHEGVPLATGQPVMLDPLPEVHKPLQDASEAATVVLPSGPLTLDGVNTRRQTNQLILYAAPQTTTGTNVYGVEVPISAGGIVQEVIGSGHGDASIPPGGFVLSVHLGDNPVKGRRVQGLLPGQHVAVLEADGQWLAGYAPTQLEAELPGGQVLLIDATDTARETGKLVLYHPGYDDGRAGTNEFGVEVAVAGGKVTTVETGQGNLAIPADGYVLSAHRGETDEATTALAGLKAGDAIRLLVHKGGEPQDLEQALAERRRVYPVDAPCRTLFLAAATGESTAVDSPLGAWVVRYADGTSERIPIRYGREALPAEGATLPARLDDPVWMVQSPAGRCLVREWANPHTGKTIDNLTFEPGEAVLEVGLNLVGVTAAVDG